MLYPKTTPTRTLLDLTGIWDFSRELGERDYCKGFVPEKLVPVPGSLNDLFTSEELRTWDGGMWSSPETFRLDVEGVQDGAAATLLPSQRLDVVFRGGAENSGEGQVDLWYTDRPAPAVAVTPAAAFVPPSTSTPTATALPTATDRPTAGFSAVAPASEENADLLLPLLLAGGGAALIVGAFVGMKLLLAGMR